MRGAIGEALRIDLLRVDALRTDAYVEALIAGTGGTGAGAEPGRRASQPTAEERPAATIEVDPEIAEAARLLHATAWRPHPSFRFEERVAARLAAAARGRLSAEDAAAGTIVAFPAAAAAVVPAMRPGAPLAGIVSAAIASAALSIGAAAVLAWRRGRPRRRVA
ncbi:MAG: hypothetical protein MUE82_02215 [Chloroflexi bacterium]|nr:hypothetical protein [Chloroflexota bacterium]